MKEPTNYSSYRALLLDGKGYIDISRRAFYSLVFGIIFCIGIIWYLTLYIYGDKEHRKGYELGATALQARMPAVSLVLNNEVFVYDQGMYAYVKKTGKNYYRIIKSYP